MLSCHDAVWLTEELLPTFEQKFEGMWNRDTLLGAKSSTNGRKATSRGVIHHILSTLSQNQATSHFYNFPKGRNCTEEFFDCGRLQQQEQELPSLPAMAELWRTCKALADETAASVQENNWSYHRISSADIATRFASDKGWPSDVHVPLVLIGRLAGSVVDGSVCFSDKTGCIRAIVDSSTDLDVWMAENIWMVHDFSVVVEVAAKHQARSRDRFVWYVDLNLKTAMCMFNAKMPFGHCGQLAQLEAPGRQNPRPSCQNMQFIVINKSMLTVHHTGNKPELSFVLDVRRLEMTSARPTRACEASSGPAPTNPTDASQVEIQLRISGEAIWMYPFIRLFECYQITAAIFARDRNATADPEIPSLLAVYEVRGCAMVENLKFSPTVATTQVPQPSGPKERCDKDIRSELSKCPTVVDMHGIHWEWARDMQGKLRRCDADKISDIRDVSLRADDFGLRDTMEILSVRGIIRSRTVNVSDNIHWSVRFGVDHCSPFAYMQGLQIVLRLQQMDGLGEESVDVYLDMFKHLTPPGLLPGVAVTLRNVGKHVSRAGKTYFRFLPVTSISVAHLIQQRTCMPAVDNSSVEQAWATQPQCLANICSRMNWTSGLFLVVGCIPRLLEASAHWICEGCGHQLPATIRPACPQMCNPSQIKFAVVVKVLFEDGTAECYLEICDEQLIQTMLDISDATFRRIKDDILRCGPQKYSSMTADDVDLVRRLAVHIVWSEVT
jgi:hypothetical protein